jgi:2,4-dienoyl-CoA reductase (NADPH2)
MDFPYLFSPITINSVTLKNRIVMSAMHMVYTPNGEVTERLIDFYALRAKGGVGLIVVGGCRFDENGGADSMLSIQDERFVPGLTRLTTAIKETGARVALQLFHAGRYARSSSMGGRRPVSASAVRSKLTGETPRALEPEEIPPLLDGFAQAAMRAKASGFDAVEIIGSAGYLISQFLSPLTNRRTDEYGGPIENRIRFATEVVQAVRSAVGPDFPVLMRIAGHDFMDGGNTHAETKIFALALEAAGVDLLNVTGGWHETRIPQLTTFVPRRAYVYLAKAIRSTVSIPVVASNRINDPKVGEDILRREEADMVSMARALIADPELPNKAYQGKSHLIYHCVACNQGCLDHIFSLPEAEPVACLVNPQAGREGELAIDPAARPKKVLVIGGGPGGMKAACTAAGRGHKVTLVEKENHLGGQLLLNRLIPGRAELVTVVEDLINNLTHLNVEVRLKTTADMNLVKEISPDAVVVATGARPILPPIPGADAKAVVQAWDVLAEKVPTGKKVIIIGGNAVGLETALYLATQGTLSPELLHFLIINQAESPETVMSLLNTGDKEVTVVEMEKKVGQNIGPSTRWTVLAELNRLGVSLLKGTRAKTIAPHGVEVEHNGKTSFLQADTIVMAVGAASDNILAEEIKTRIREVRLVGDAREPRKAMAAIREGFVAGLNL